MKKTRICALLTAVFCLGALLLPAAAAQVRSGSVYCFTPQDFSGEAPIAGVCLTSLPENGTVRLGDRVLRAGDILTADQTAQMTFAPFETETDTAAQVGYLPIWGGKVGTEAVMTIGILGREDKAPIAQDGALETYKNLSVKGTLKVSDPEGKPVTFTLVRSPKRGEVVIAEDGTFTYTPKKNKIGVDSFTFTATDPAGKTSREATVTVTILKPTDSKQYRDTLGRDCRFAAEWMRHTGIFTGETVAENPCFGPDKPVSRGEFLTMLVKTLDIPMETELTAAYSDDIPQWLQPYLAAAIRAGLTAGLPEQETFGADTPITGAEAAVMLQNALDLKVEHTDETLVPAWAADALGALADFGIELDPQAPVTREAAAAALYRMHRGNAE